MTEQVEGSFRVTSWDEKLHEGLGGEAKLTKVTVVQQYSGGLDATASWEVQMFYRGDGTAFYTGLQHFVGTLDGRAGTFLSETRGEYDGSQAMSEWGVVPRSGTGELAGLEGSGTSTAAAGTEGSFMFDYDIHGV